MKLIANKEDMEKQGSNIIELSVEYSEKIKEIKNVCDKIGRSWSGIDATLFIENLNGKCVPALEQVATIIENFGVYLQKIPSIYSTFDKNAADDSKKN